MSKAFLRLANGLVSLVVAVALITAGGYAAYCLWDDGQIYAAAEDVQAELLHLKPQVEPAEDGESGGPSFDELLAINPDVRAWVTMDNTKIDHPVLQGETNLDYINTDVYGDFALAGSIFLDARNDPDFADPYSLLYGHHMANSGMFGDLDLYKDPEFFAENQTGTLILPDGACALEVFACMLVSASEDRNFYPIHVGYRRRRAAGLRRSRGGQLPPRSHRTAPRAPLGGRGRARAGAQHVLL